jgi:PII-like signaling protein
MQTNSEAKLLRIFMGESDKVRHQPLYEAIVREAHAAGLSGATAWKGMMGFGASSHIRTAKILDLAADLPLVVEITDQEEKINAFLPRLHALFEQAQCGGLVTMENVQVIRYTRGK